MEKIVNGAKIRTIIFMGRKTTKTAASRRKPLKPPTLTDIALRIAISDLLGRKQIPVLSKFAEQFKFNQSNQLSYFLNGERNFPKAKVELAIKLLRDRYGMNEEFLRTGHGKIYRGAPYQLTEEIDSLVNEMDNVLTIGGVNKVEKLKEAYRELKEKVELLENMIHDKNALIKMQQSIIEKSNIEKPGR